MMESLKGKGKPLKTKSKIPVGYDGFGGKSVDSCKREQQREEFLKILTVTILIIINIDKL